MALKWWLAAWVVIVAVLMLASCRRGPATHTVMYRTVNPVECLALQMQLRQAGCEPTTIGWSRHTCVVTAHCPPTAMDRATHLRNGR